MKKGDISQLTKELTDFKNLKIETEDISYSPSEKEISKNMLKIYKIFAKLVTKAVE